MGRCYMRERVCNTIWMKKRKKNTTFANNNRNHQREPNSSNRQRTSMKLRFTYLLFFLLFQCWTMQAQPTFSKKHGLYDRKNLVVSIFSSDPEAEIHYTTDGSTPTAQSARYKSPVVLKKTACLRAVEVKDSVVSSRVTTATYIFVSSVLAQQGTPSGYPTQWGSYCQISGTAKADYDMNAAMTQDEKLQPHIVAGLSEIPILSLVTDKDYFFSHDTDPETGGIYIYTGTPVGNSIGRGWERPVSAELMGGPQEHDLTIDCGVSIHGGHGRLPEKNPKHSLRLKFKKEYGAGKLSYPLFDRERTEDFDQLVLRCHFGNSWQHWNSPGRTYAQYARDLWARNMQGRMGHAYSRGLYVHLFINGLYWGLYNIAERVDDTFCKTHFGGKKGEYDVIKQEEEGGNHIEATEGTVDKWNQLFDIAQYAADDAYYYQLQGLNEAGEEDETVEPLLDMDNFIDYILINQFGGNTDWDEHNWYAVARRGDEPMGFHFICWDTEQIFESPTENILKLNTKGRPTRVFQNLMENPQFLHRYMDRAHELLTNDGWLTEKAVVAVWDSLYHTIENAIYDEAARWGDYRLVVHPYSSRGKDYDVDNYYMSERNRLLSNYFPTRSRIFLEQLVKQGWYPHSEAPQLLVNGQAISTDTLSCDDELTFASDGKVYYTTDGLAPVSWAGGDHQGHLTASANIYSRGNLNENLPHDGQWISIRAIAQNSNEWSPAIQHRFFLAAPSAIVAVHEEEHNADDAYYNLNGQRVNHPTRGIYIRNGKKIYVK